MPPMKLNCQFVLGDCCIYKENNTFSLLWLVLLSFSSTFLPFFTFCFMFLCNTMFMYRVFLQVGEYDSVIIMTHEPNWLLDWYWDDTTGKNVSYLIKDLLKGRCKLRMAGDLHHYMRHSHVPSEKPVYVQHLLVNGCGGAFLHPTHVFSNFDSLYETPYESKAAYPSFEDSSRVQQQFYDWMHLLV